MKWESLEATTLEFRQKISAALEELDMLERCKALTIDHVCVRVANSETVEELKVEIASVGKIISSTVVNGREISIIQLEQALDLGAWTTSGVELPHPKQNHTYTDGWEHVEFVLEGAENTMDGVREAFFSLFPHLDIETLRASFSYKESEPHSDDDQLPNPTVAIKIDGIGLKFHALPIQEVVGFAV